MIGIYKITNKINGRSYIGQSKDIEKRWKEHVHHKDSPIDKNIYELGDENFELEVLEECSPDQLDEKEDFYIKKYDSINNGYNRIGGGQHNRNGSNPKAKLTIEEVAEIRKAYGNRESKRKVYEKYKDKVSFYHFSNVWAGYVWSTVHPEVFTAANLKFYSSNGGANNMFTFAEVMNYRTQYITQTAAEIYEKTDKRCSFDAFQKMLWGNTYKDIPIFDKRNNRWIVEGYI